MNSDNYYCYSIKSINNKGIFLVWGYDRTNNSENIYVYRSDNQTIENTHDNNRIIGFLEINNHLIYSYSKDKTIKNWLI